MLSCFLLLDFLFHIVKNEISVPKKILSDFFFDENKLMRISLIGESSLGKLRKTCQLAPVATNIPSLVEVLPYLEVTPHQEYLVRCLNGTFNRAHMLRFRPCLNSFFPCQTDLAAGGCMGNFRWDGGAKRKLLDESLPTDCAVRKTYLKEKKWFHLKLLLFLQVAMHCLATYMDSQLPAFTDRPDRRPFTGQYLVKCPEKPSINKSLPVIVEVQLSPPHYKLVMGSDEYELPKVRNSL